MSSTSLRSIPRCVRAARVTAMSSTTRWRPLTEPEAMSSGTTYQGNPAGLIEYRYEPEWWVLAVGQRLNEASTHTPASS